MYRLGGHTAGNPKLDKTTKESLDNIDLPGARHIAMSSSVDIPPFSALPLNPAHPPHSAWDVWGRSDRLGTLNHLSPDRVVDAAQEIREGVRIGLDLALDQSFFRPGFRSRPAHEVFDIGDNMHVSCGSHDSKNL